MGIGLMRMGMMGGRGTSDGWQGTRRNKVAYIKREQLLMRCHVWLAVCVAMY